MFDDLPFPYFASLLFQMISSTRVHHYLLFPVRPLVPQGTQLVHAEFLQHVHPHLFLEAHPPGEGVLQFFPILVYL
jgi:hypothetical protein